MSLFKKIKTSLSKPKENNFKYLSDLVENETQIKLNTDIALDDGESDDFSNGIKISKDNVIIDGNGHVIDGKNKARFFEITGTNVIIKNFIFKNGYFEFGGWIQNNGEAEIINCEFRKDSSINSTTIYNYSKINIDGCKFDVKTTILMNSSMGRCNIKGCRLKNERIDNKGFIFIQENEKHLENIISNDKGQVFIISKNPQNISDRFYNLIHRQSEITLSEDLVLDEKSIILDVDNLIIDGNYHFITSRHELGAIKVLANNITLKNIFFIDSHAKYIDGGAIESRGENLRIENCVFENNSTMWSGGAIESRGSLRIENSIFSKNFANNGEVLSSMGDLKIINCEFTSNESTCTSSRGSLTIENTEFKDNLNRCLSISGRAIIEDSKFLNCIENGHELINADACDLEMAKSRLLSKNQSEGLKARDSKLNIKECSFEDNLKAIVTEKCDLTLEMSKFTNNNESILSDSYLNIHKCEFSDTGKSERAIMIEGGEDSAFNIQNSTFNCESLKIIHIIEGHCIFKHNTYNLNGNYAIFNERGEIDIKKEKFNNATTKSIYNNNILKSDDDIGNLIENGSDSKLKTTTETLPSDHKGFAHLEELIDENDEITLEYDITLHESEKDYFEGGIEISKDNLKINGNGHTIDACEFSRIFLISSKNITLENMTFRNGKYIRSKLDNHTCGGGAIHLLHDTSLKLVNCIFKDNSSRQSSGAIKNSGDELTIIDCEFENNIAHNGNSGAIYNEKGDLNMKSSEFKSNNSNTYAGAIYNKDGKINVDSCGFKNNNVEKSYFGGNEGGDVYNVEKDRFKENRGGAIYNKAGDLCIINSNFEANECSKGGGIFNEGDSFKIEDSYFSENHAEEGASIYILNKNEFAFCNCTFENNESQGAGIYNNGSILNLEECNFNDNHSTHPGGALYNNKGTVNIKHCNFKSNRAVWGKCGGAMGSFYGTTNIENCNFYRNSARNGGAIENYGGKWSLKCCNFDENVSEWKGGSILNRQSGYIKLANCNFNNNEARTATDIYNLDGEMEFNDCGFENNEETIIINKDTITLKGCRLADYHEIFDFENATTNIKG